MKERVIRESHEREIMRERKGERRESCVVVCVRFDLHVHRSRSVFVDVLMYNNALAHTRTTHAFSLRIMRLFYALHTLMYNNALARTRTTHASTQQDFQRRTKILTT